MRWPSCLHLQFGKSLSLQNQLPSIHPSFHCAELHLDHDGEPRGQTNDRALAAQSEQ